VSAPVQTPITGKECLVSSHSVLYALVGFYSAFNTRDLGGMSRNWAQSDDIAMSNPLGGLRRGWEEIRGVYERIFNGPAKVYVEFHDYTLHESETFFYAVGRERGYLERDGKRLDLAIRTSRVFRKLDGRWQQVHHHGSIEDPALLERYQKAVRGEAF
jgi:ketosteroid isomerase-like protein